MFQFFEEVDSRLDIIQVSSIGQRSGEDGQEGIICLAWIAVDANHILVAIVEQVLERSWWVLDYISVNDESLSAIVFSTPVSIGVFETSRNIGPMGMNIWCH